MNYSVDILIEKPRDEVVKIYDNAENLYKWMDGLHKIEYISGNSGEKGAKSQLFFKMGKREIDMLETIMEKSLPDKYTATYETKGVLNTVTVRFEEMPGEKTRYITDQDFQFTGLMKILSLLMKSAFKKQSMKNLKDFKKFAESQS
jgi:uncharacterized membrane protein